MRTERRVGASDRASERGSVHVSVKRPTGWLLAGMAVGWAASGAPAAGRVENLAPKAKVSASSEHSAPYAAGLACDGKIPPPASHADAGKAWCAKGNRHPKGVRFTLEWPEPVTVAEIVYYGRTAFHWAENWKDCEVYLEPAGPGPAKPAARVVLKPGHGPQRIPLPKPTAVRKVTLTFLSSYGATNPGASEIEVYSARPTEAQLGRFVPPPAGAVTVMPIAPPAGEPPVDLRALRGASENLTRTFPRRYPKGRAFLKRLGEVTSRLRSDPRDEGARRAAAALRREALLANPLLDFDRLLVVRRGRHLGLPVNNSVGNAYMPRSGYDDELAILSPVRPDTELATLYKPKAAVFVGDVELHWDAGRLLFSSIGPDGRWHIYEIGVDGKGLRRVTPSVHKDVDSYDACYLPDERIIFSSTTTFQGLPCNGGHGDVANLHLLDADGKRIRRLCFDQEHNFCPVVLPDGRVLYLRWEYCDLPHFASGILFHMNPDGTGQMEHYGSGSYWPNRINHARPIPGRPSWLVGVVGGHHDRGRMGDLVLFDPDRARFEADGVIQRIPARGKRVEPVIRDLLISGLWPKFLHPYPLGDASTPQAAGKYFLVSCCPAPGSRWAIYLVDVFDNMLLLKSLPDSHLFEPTPIRKRPRPPVIPDRVDLRRTDAVVYLLDVYAGRGLAGVPRGTVKKLRLFTYHFAFRGIGGQQSRVGIDGPWEPKRVLGTVPVEPDGSAVFRVPANTPISVQPLDAEGKALQLMRSWFTAMPGENLSCVGCHESQARSPSAAADRLRRVPTEITPWYGPVRGFSFQREVQPVLDRYCVGCHNARRRPDGGVLPDLRAHPGTWDPRPPFGVTGPGFFTPSYRILHPLVRSHTLESDIHLLSPCEFHADTTRLVQMLRKGHHGVKLDREAWDRLITWIDLNTPAHGTWHEVTGNQRDFRQQCGRRRAMWRHYAVGRGEDPEAVPDPPAKPVRPMEVKPLPPLLAGRAKGSPWPDAATPPEAARRVRSIDLGQGVKIDLVLIPAGEFVMGSASGEADERPATRVRIARPFWIGRCEVTNEQFRRFDASHDSGREQTPYLLWGEENRGAPQNGPAQPVLRVSWRRARDFCRWLSRRAQPALRFDLPTEAQWEYACRAGTSTPLSCPPTRPRLHRRNASYAAIPTGTSTPATRYTRNVGEARANAWGVHDMHGNAAEWTLSAYRPYPYRPDDGRNAPAPDGRKVVRGGSFYDPPERCRSAHRLRYPSWRRVFDVGFRVACPAGAEAKETAPAPLTSVSLRREK